LVFGDYECIDWSLTNIGFITPPIGLNLFVISGVTGESILNVAKYVFPYVFAMLAVAVLIAFVPQLSLVLLGR